MKHYFVEHTEFYLRKIAVLIRYNTRELLAQYDLTLPQYYALLQLRERSLTMGELCSRLYLASSTVTDLVDRMEKLNLVSRVQDEQDRRVFRIKLLDSGRKIIERVMQERLKLLSKKLIHLEEEKLTVFLNVLEDLYNMMEED